MDNFEYIIEKARELAEMIEKSPVAIEYFESISVMQRDLKAQQLLSRLITMGREINEALRTGDDASVAGGAEAEILREEIEKNDTVKQYILAQKNYVNMIKLVQERIKNPVDKKHEQ